MSGFDEQKVKTYHTDRYEQGDPQGDHEVIDVSVKSYSGSSSIKVDASRAVFRGRGVRRYNLGWMSSESSRALARLLMQASDKLDGLTSGKVDPNQVKSRGRKHHKGALSNVGTKS